VTREALADRLVNYADAITAFAVVNTLAFLLALTETEIRCSLVPVQWLVYFGQAFVGISITLGVVALRRIELRLRAAADPLPLDMDVLLRRFFLVRLAIVWVAVSIAAGLSTLPLSDPSCLPPAA
jgi:hypothetical protein